MYSDNETVVDLLGFEDQVDDICLLALDPKLLPITIGVLGDWGSGKSSLLRMAEAELTRRGAIVVYFSPWRIEDYDDAKAALLDAVVHEVESHLQNDGLAEHLRQSLLAKIGGLRRRVRWMRAAGMAAKHIVTMTAPSLDDLDTLLREDSEEDLDVPSTARLTRDFHEEFSAVVDGLDTTVVVLVDDLDRCQPEQVLDVLHAMRLFLCVPGTAFVIATDERVVRDAVRLRYPQASEASETDLPQEYLEKIIQVPLRIPPLSAVDVETYLNLLVAEGHLAEAELQLLREKAKALRSQGLTRASINVGVAREATTLPAEAEAEFELIARIAAVLGTGLKGNPRQLKRFLNGLELRRSSAVRRGVDNDLDLSVLAKLGVLEYVDRRRFRELHTAQLLSGGAPQALVELEAFVQRPGVVDVTEGPLANWSSNAWIRGWLAIDPPLAGVDLGPYFVLARDAVFDSSLQARRLPQELQALLESLASTAAPQRTAAASKATGLPPDQRSQLIDAALERMPTDPNAVEMGLALASIAAEHTAHVGPVLNGLSGLPYTQIGIAVPGQLASRLRESAPDQLRELLDEWIGQGASPRLSRAAQQARRLLDGDQ